LRPATSIELTMPTPTTDFSIFDWQELVSYVPVTDEPLENLPALRRPLTQSGMWNVERYIELNSKDVFFFFDGTNLASKILSVGDAIADSQGVMYQVLIYERQTLNNIVAVVCRHTE
jgi:hypothetical protein